MDEIIFLYESTVRSTKKMSYISKIVLDIELATVLSDCTKIFSFFSKLTLKITTKVTHSKR